MADSTVPVPATCSAQCSLDCDVWSGTIQCQGDSGTIKVWGGLSSMAGMELDQKGAQLEGEEKLSNGDHLSWGTSPAGEFCATVAWHPSEADPGDPLNWTWQLCGRPSAATHTVLLGIVRAHARYIPGQRVLKCENQGC
jgi:hypothetical protein